MPGFPLMAIGAGLGQFAKQQAEQQAARERQQMLAITLAKFQQEQKDRADQQQAEGGLFSALAGMGGGTGITPVGGAPPQSGGYPGSGAMPQAAPPPQPMGGGGGGVGGGLSIENMTQLASQAGFSPDKAPLMAAIAMAESSGNPNAHNNKGRDDSYGLTQINALAHGPIAREALDPKRAFELAYDVSKGGTDFTPWTTFTKGLYKSYLRPGGTGQGRTPPQMPAASPGGMAPMPGGRNGAPPTVDEFAAYVDKEAAKDDGVVPSVTDTPGGTNGIVPTGAPAGPQVAQAGPQTATDAAPPPSVQQEVQQGVQKTVQGLPGSPMALQGRMSLPALAQQINKANPGANSHVKMLMLQQAEKLLAPDQRAEMQMLLMQNRQELQLYLANKRAEDAKGLSDMRIEAAKGAQANKGYTLITDPATGKSMWAKPGEPSLPVDAPVGATKMGGPRPGGSPLDAAQAKFWGGVVKSGGSLPPGLRRSGVVEQIMKEVGSDASMTPGDFISKHSEMKANTTSLTNMTKMADAAISFENLAEKNFDVALKMAPNAVPTDLGPFFNRWVEQGEAMLGDPSVPAYVTAIITGANEYAKVMSGSTGTAASTVDSRREARELFSPYLSLPQISQVIAVAKADMKNRENTLTEQTNLIKQRLGSTAPVPIAPPATPRGTGQESQNTPAAASGVGSAYKSADDVFRAIDSGALTPEAGKKIVIEQFGYTPAPAQQ